MIMTLVGGLFLAGWISLASMRAAYSRNAETAAKRRLMLENSKAYGQQIARQNAMSGNSTMGAVASYLNDGTGTWGGVDTGAGWSNLQLYALPGAVSYPATGYYSTLFPYNSTGMRPGASYISTQQLQRPSALQNTVDPFTGYLFLKAINPCLAGDGMVIYRKPDVEPGEVELASNLYVNGRLVVRDPACFYNASSVNLGAPFRVGTYCKSFYLQKYDPLNRVTGTDTGGLQLLPSNMPAMPSTYGPAGVSDLYRGDLNVIQNSANPANSLWDMQQRESDAGRSTYQTISDGTAFGNSSNPVYIVDETNPPYPPPAWPSGYPHIWKVMYVNLDNASLPNLRVYGVINQIVFFGQTTAANYNAAASLTPRSILVVPDALGRTVQDFAFVRENNRPLILGAKGSHRERLDMFWTGGTIPSVTTPLTADWRLIFINEYRQVTVYPPSTGGVNAVSIVGGFLTNWSVKRLDSGAASTFTLTPEWNGSYTLASLLPRDAWLESYFQLTSP